MSKFRQFFSEKNIFYSKLHNSSDKKSSKQLNIVKNELSYRLLEREKNFTVLYCAHSFSTVNSLYLIYLKQNTLVDY